MSDSGTNGDALKTGTKSTEVVGLPVLVGLLTSLIASGAIKLDSERMQIVVIVTMSACWALLFVGRTLLKMGHAKAGTIALTAQAIAEAALQAYEKKTGKDLPLPNDVPATQPDVPKS